MPSSAKIQWWPEPRFHAFLSHSAEDRSRLVEPVRQELLARCITPWFDQTEYPAGMDPFYTLQESLLDCLHVVYFVTHANVSQGRGWSASERTISTNIQSHFISGPDTLHNYQLALYFTPQTHTETMKSVWNPLRQYGRTTNHRVGSQNSIKWAADTIEEFLKDQYQHRLGTLHKIAQDSSLKQFVDKHQGLHPWLQAPKVLPF